VLIDRAIPKLQAELDSLNKIVDANKVDAAAPTLTPDQKKEFVAVTSELKVLTDRREKILARAGDEYVTQPPKVQSKP